MDENNTGAPPSRLVVFRYMTYEDIARVLMSTPEHAQSLVARRGWRLHSDAKGRARASVPEAYLQAWAAISASLGTRPSDPAVRGFLRRDEHVGAASGASRRAEAIL
jgi:hypothetical protein